LSFSLDHSVDDQLEIESLNLKPVANTAPALPSLYAIFMPIFIFFIYFNHLPNSPLTERYPMTGICKISRHHTYPFMLKVPTETAMPMLKPDLTPEYCIADVALTASLGL